MSGIVLAIIGAAVASFLAGVGSTLGVSRVGRSGAGLLAEDSSQFGSILLFCAIPGSQAVYGMLAAILILQNTGLLAGAPKALTPEQGFLLLLAGLPVAITCLFSGMFQGGVLASGVQMIAKDKSQSGQVIIMGALVETFAIFGLLVSILMINGVKIA
jgi:V/A-type H+/Na+-transporting ATPase subunit K